MTELNSFEHSILKKLCYAGAHDAASTLGHLMGHKISVKEPDFFIAPFDRVPELLSGRLTTDHVVSLYTCQLSGDVAGQLLLMLEPHHSLSLPEIREVDPSDDHLEMMNHQKLIQTGTMLAQISMHGISAYLDLKIDISGEFTLTDMHDSIINSIVAQHPDLTEEVLVLRVALSCEAIGFEANGVCFFNHASAQTVIARVDLLNKAEHLSETQTLSSVVIPRLS